MNPLPGPVARSAQRRAPALHRSGPVVQPLRLLHELLHGLDGVLELREAAGVHEDAHAFAVESGFFAMKLGASYDYEVRSPRGSCGTIKPA